MTIIEALRSVDAYPIPLRTITITAIRRELTPTAEVDADTLKGRMYNLAVADLLMWLSKAPSVTQGGQSYTIGDKQRTLFRNRAESIYKDFGADGELGTSATNYGYKGSRL